PGIALGADDVRHRPADARVERRRVGHGAGVQRLEERSEIVGSGEAPRVRREDAVGAGVHGAVRYHRRPLGRHPASREIRADHQRIPLLRHAACAARSVERNAKMSGADGMRARGSRVRWARVLAAGAGLAVLPSPSSALSVQEALLQDVPAVALVSAEVKASATVNCGQGPITVTPRPFIEVGTGWFVDGRGYLITNTHVIDPAYRVPPWVAFDLKLRAVEEGCGNPALRARGLARGQRPDLEEDLLRAIPLAGVALTTTGRVSVLLSNGANLEAQVAKFSAPITLDAQGNPFKDSGRDLALLRIEDGAYPALSITDREPKVGDELHILGFPGV